MHKLTYLILTLLLATPATAQDVEGFFGDIKQRLADREYLKIRGRAGARLGYNYFDDGGSGARPRNAPFTWNANAGLNFDLLGMQLPFSAAISSRNTLYNLPSYSFIGLSPTYKWITLHGGDRSLTFSPYSLSGINFRGGGFELKPGNFYVAAMRGKLRRARIQDITAIQSGLDTRYRRMATGVKFGFDNQEGTAATVSWFSSKDELEGTTDSLRRIQPEANMVLTFSGSHRLSSLVSFNVEYAQSALTRDVNSPQLADPDGRLNLFGLFDARTTTGSANAYNGSVVFSPEFATFDVKYERIAPGYRTHGSLFFQNDVERITTGARAPLFDNKLNLTASVGFQRNNLNGDQAENLNRFIGNVNASWKVSDRVTNTFGVSNFTTTNRLRTINQANQIVDSIVIAQTQFSAKAGTTVLLREDGSQTLFANASFQRADLIREDEVQGDQRSNFVLAMVGYNLKPKDGNYGLNATLLFHRNETAVVNLSSVGPTLGYQRTMLAEKLTLRVSSTYSFTSTSFRDPALGGTDRASLVQVNGGLGYELGEKQSIDLNTSLISAATTDFRPGYTDGQISLQYGLSF
ncbi:TonB-dependent receptor [Neolewinella antarctica]|uniref:Uncharacterized protein n=1 Tax=Neolewinella antarctica TaxID=442734 RepID=A0ABX0XEE2_9BACT|nr:hypothetical protein [Neolewinella antarctica]NJC27686.1 hypothetical protein [Neolewinella antarctica]